MNPALPSIVESYAPWNTANPNVGHERYLTERRQRSRFHDRCVHHRRGLTGDRAARPQLNTGSLRRRFSRQSLQTTIRNCGAVSITLAELFQLAPRVCAVPGYQFPKRPSHPSVCRTSSHSDGASVRFLNRPENRVGVLGGFAASESRFGARVDRHLKSVARAAPAPRLAVRRRSVA